MEGGKEGGKGRGRKREGRSLVSDKETQRIGTEKENNNKKANIYI